MAYEIHDGPAPIGARVETRGRKGRYPLRALQVGQWLAAPLAEERQLRMAVRYVERTCRQRFQVRGDTTGLYWCAIRIEDGPAPVTVADGTARGPGRQSRYALRQMRVSDCIAAPRDEQHLIKRALRYNRLKHGHRYEWHYDAPTGEWWVMRIA